MLCAKCGQPIEEGNAFCKFCGTPVAQPPGSPTADTSIPGDPGVTAVRPRSDVTPASVPAVTPLPPPSGGTASPGSVLPGEGGGYGAGWQPPYGPPEGRGGGKRTGIVMGAVVAAIIVLAGLGIGLWLGLRSDDGSTSSASDVTTGVTTGGGSMTTVSDPRSGAGETVAGGGPTTTGPASTEGTTTTEDLLTGWYFSHDELVAELDYDDVRIPELADEINVTLPDVPQWVYDELAGMADSLSGAVVTMQATPVPAGFEEAQSWLLQAAGYMTNRIQATMDGIYAMWYTGSVGSATDDFNKGRAERDAYRDAMTEHWDHMPPD
jgi:hypothetical protein